MCKIICLKIAKMGYYGGNPDFVRKAPVDDIISILDYENYNIEYEKKFADLNRES